MKSIAKTRIRALAVAVAASSLLSACFIDTASSRHIKCVSKGGTMIQISGTFVCAKVELVDIDKAEK